MGSGAVFRTIPEHPACKNRRDSASDNVAPQITADVGISDSRNSRKQLITPSTPYALSSRSTEGVNARVASMALARQASDPIIRKSFAESKRLRKPSTAIGSVSQTISVCTIHHPCLSTWRLDYFSIPRGGYNKIGERQLGGPISFIARTFENQTCFRLQTVCSSSSRLNTPLISIRPHFHFGVGAKKRGITDEQMRVVVSPLRN